MHELGIMTGVMDAVQQAAQQAGATKVIKVSLSVGVMTEAIEDALEFAFEALRDLEEYSLCKGAELEIAMVEPKSLCLACGLEYTHDRFHMTCPVCDSPETKLVAGRDLRIESIEVDLPDDEDESSSPADDPHAAEA